MGLVRMRIVASALLALGLTLWSVHAAPVPTSGASASAVAASAASAPATYVPRVKPYADDILAGLSIFTAVGLTLAFLFSLWLVGKEWLRDPLIIEPFDAPKDLQDLGLTGAVLSQQLYDAILDLQRNARPDDGPADIAFVELPRLLVDLQLPGMSWSVRGVIRYLKQAVGRTERRLVGEVIKRGKVYEMRLRSATGRAIDVEKGFHGASDLPMTLVLAAEAAVMLTNSLEGASILYSQETPRTRYVKTLAALRFHLSSASARTHQDAYVLWASVCRALGDQAGMESRLALARAAETSRWSGAETHRLRPRYLNFTGSLARERGRFSEAQEAFTQARGRDRRNVGALTNLGLLALDMDDFGAAQRWFRALIRLKPTSGRGYRGLGLLAEREGDWEAAVRWLTRAVDLTPRARWPRVNRIDALRVLGQLDAAQVDADAFVAEDPDFSPLYRFRSSIASDRGDLQGARTWAEQAAKTDPTDPWAFIFVARTAQRLGDQTAAFAAVDRALTLRPGMPEAMRCRAAGLAAMGRADKAEAALQEGASANRRDLWCLLELSDLYRQRGRHDDALAAADAALQRRTRDPNALRRWSWVLRDRGDLRGAEVRLRAAAASWPKDMPVQRDLADILRRQRRFDESIAHARGSLSVGVRPSMAYIQMARAYRDWLRTSDVEASLRAAIEAEPDDVMPSVELADFLRQQERFAEAQEILATRAASGPANAALLRRWAAVLSDLGDPVGAARRYAEALASAPADIDLCIDAANFERGRGDLDAALVHANCAVDLRRDAVAAWRCKAQILDELDDPAGADAALRSAIDWAPGDIWARVALCSLLRRRGRPDEAAAVAEALSDRRPDSQEGRIQAGWVENMRGDLSAAEDWFATAVSSAVAPELRPRLQYGDFLLRHDRFEDAIAQADAALRTDPLSLEAMALKFSVHRTAGSDTGAIETAEHWASVAPGEIEPLLRLADVHENATRTDKAREALGRALHRRPTSLRVRRELLRLAIRQKAWGEAEQWLEQLCNLAAVDVQDLLTWARAWQDRDATSASMGPPCEPLRQALAAATQALQRQPSSVDALRMTANLHEDCGDPAAAEEAWRAAVQAKPQDASAAERLAALLRKQGRLAEAAGVLRSALLHSPRSGNLATALARTLWAVGDRHTALRQVVLLKRSIPPHQPWALLSLAHLLGEFGCKRNAASLAQRAAALTPPRADVMRSAAHVIKRAGKLAEANELLRAADTLDAGPASNP